MLKKVLFVTLVSFCLLFSAMARKCLADPADQLEQAEIYKKDGDYQQAEAIYKTVVQENPGTDYALDAQKRLAILYLDISNEGQAQLAVDELVAGFSGNVRIAEAVHEIAGHCRWLKKYEKSKQLCQHVVDSWPGSKSAMWSQMGVAMANISLGEPDAAAAAIDKLVADFSGNEHIAQAVHEIAGHCNFLEKHQKARELHQYVLDNWPDSKQAMWSQMGVAVSNTALGETEAAAAAVDKLLADFSENEQIADAVRQVANAHRKSGKYEKASELYQYVIANWPGSEQVRRSQMGLAMLDIAVKDGADAELAMDKLIADFGDHPDLPRLISSIEEAYYIRILSAETWLEENYLYPVELWEKVMAEIPDLFHDDPDLYYFIACCYYQLGDYEKAIQHYKIVADRWLDYEYAWNAQFLVGHYYERLGDGGVIAGSVADAETKAAYERVLERYPNCKAAKAARSWLEKN